MYIEKLHKLWLCQNANGGIYLTPKMANRHGLIAGATGTGKTVTLKVMAEGFSEMGVPVFLADIKGDVSGMCLPGEDSEGFQKRIKNKLGLEMDWKFQGYPLRFWDVYGKMGLPVRTTISEMGPELLSRLLELNDTQSGVMNIVFRVADEQGLLLLDLKDLRSMVQYVGDNAADIKLKYGNVSSQSLGAIQRALLRLEDQGGNIFFGEPALDIKDWFATEDGKGVINLLHCTELFQNPLLYSTFLLWMLSELYEMMPEAGDLEKPKMVFFFDEAHLIFKDAPRSLLDKVEQIVRLIRSKGIGIYFITQQPADIPDSVLAQLGNKLQHALRAYTPKERKGLKAAAQAFRPNPELNAETALGELGTGEVLVSLLDAEGVPTMVQRAYVMPPRSYLGTCSDEMRQKAIKNDALYSKYAEAIDRESAYEVLMKRAEQAEAETQECDEDADEETTSLREEVRRNAPRSTSGRSTTAKTSARRTSSRAPKEAPSVLEKVATSALQTFGRSIATGLARGLLGSLLKKK
ncbi:helicase HerA-like domain-containing protein [Phascolarctobacterium sp.]|uniref:helicase HerA-like domain-containing protein n=1 Tax=Phascolarctobacterium sp. TaxID=2049039 RepID=UPI003864C21E